MGGESKKGVGHSAPCRGYMQLTRVSVLEKTLSEFDDALSKEDLEGINKRFGESKNILMSLVAAVSAACNDLKKANALHLQKKRDAAAAAALLREKL